MTRVIRAADLFCGAGGTSTGLVQACLAMGLDLRLVGVNHWDTAMETFTRNHPRAEHWCTGIDQIKPSRAVPGRKLDLLVASPECTHHSNARGGKPRDEQSRASAWHVLHWCQELYVKNLILENVPEFTNWGPLTKEGRPVKARAGDTFRAFLGALESLGYRYRWDYLTAADYGDATTRRRFFLYATRGRGGLAWPARSHLADPAGSLFQAAPWRPAREVIDWTIPGHSIFLTREDVRRHKVNVQRPLKPNTLRRIEAGIRKFWGEWAEPFLVILRGTQAGQIDGSAIRLDRPLPTTTACGHVGLVQPFMVPFFGERSGQAARCQDLAGPLASVTSHGAGGIVQPFLLQCAHGDHKGDHRRRASSLSSPLQTVAGARGTFALLQPFILGQQSGGAPRSLDKPLVTICTESRGIACVQPFLIRYNGTSQAFSVADPISTIDTHDRLGLVRPMLVEAGGQRYLLDILFRMLTVKELAAAHSFPSDYFFAGNKSEQVKQIGNSVPVRLAEALARQALSA